MHPHSSAEKEQIIDEEDEAAGSAQDALAATSPLPKLTLTSQDQPHPSTALTGEEATTLLVEDEGGRRSSDASFRRASDLAIRPVDEEDEEAEGGTDHHGATAHSNGGTHDVEK